MTRVSRSNTKWQSAAATMRPARCLRSCALIAAGVTLLHSPAQAARFTLLSVNDLHQFVALSYNYQGSQNEYGTGNNNSTHHGFSESYSIGAGYSILHPRLLRGDASITLVANQNSANKSNEGSSSSSDNRISYSVNGIILDRKPYPIHFSAQSSTLTIRPPFSRSYTVDSQDQNISLNLQNRYLPVSFSYGRNESTTSGLVDDIAHTSQTASITLTHNTGGLSSTRLALGLTSDQQTLLDSGTTDDRNESTFDLANALSWLNVRGLQRRLDTKYYYRARSGDNPGSQSNFDTALHWQIGKALDSRLTFAQNRNEDAQRSNNLQSITGSLTQKYLKCLQTSVGGAFVSGRYNDGSDVNVSWNAGVGYTNELPRDSRIGLNYGYHYALQDQKRSDISLGVLEAVPLSSPFPLFLDLAAQNIDSSTIAFYRDAGKTLPFTDFTVVLSGTQTRILINSDPGVPIVYISYFYHQNPDIKYSTTGHSIGGRLSLFGSKHVLDTNYSWSDTHILAGADANSAIGGSRHLKIGIESQFTPHTLSLKYSSDKNVYQDIQNVEAKWSHTMVGRSNTMLLTKAEDRYSWYANKAGDAGSTQGWDNTFLLSTTYSRPVVQNVTGKLTLGYFNLQNSSISSNKFNIVLGLVGNYGRTVISLDSSSNWSFSSSGSARNQSVALNARRSF